YAIFFVHPDTSSSRYCHKIFVFEPYRGHGIGTQLLNGVLDYSQGTCLLCNHDLIPFYERAGLEFKGDFTPPTAQQGFALTRDMYVALAIMGSPGIEGSSPVFMLNDDDIKQLLAV
ncbi:GNAT family N-acetyltransferase, partial [Pseudomonas viridiflava]|uniref:GNAT family N-acetyltransferase n=1 Tax=Pseudomonas viridiflava TaxID=33069 RepID=UPI0013DEB647